jgi:hypothetical protein
MKDLIPLHYFLGIQVQCSTSRFFLHQAKYAEDILDSIGMVNCKPSPTPVDSNPKSSLSDGSLASDASFYHNITRVLQYLTLTQPDTAYIVHQVCLHMHASTNSHWALIKWILLYICGTTSHSIHLHASTDVQIKTYSNVD